MQINQKTQHLIAGILYLIICSIALFFLGTTAIPIVIIALLPVLYVIFVKFQERKAALEREAARHHALVVEFERTHPQ